MARPHSTDTPETSKVQKPYDGFPLFPHATGRWAKKIRGRLVYFGKVADGWEKALESYNAQKDDLHAGRRPRGAQVGGVTIRDLCNHFWNAKNGLVKSGELSPRTLLDYENTTDLVVDHFGKGRLVSDVRADDFPELRDKLAKRLGPVALGKQIQMVRMVFKFAFDSELIDRPIRFGPGFKRPSKKTLRLEKAKKGKKLFTADEIANMIEAAGLQLKAMILLGINCGFGNADCGTLPLSALDLDQGWLNYHRPKTGIDRRCPLWPETVHALRDAIVKRPDPKNQEDLGLAFITKYGKRWAKDDKDNPISKECRKLLDGLGINGHRSFYTLRHSFQTIGDETKDFVAVRDIMGHADDSMSATYREGVSDARLKGVTDYVRGWVFHDAGKVSPSSQGLGKTEGA